MLRRISVGLAWVLLLWLLAIACVVFVVKGGADSAWTVPLPLVRAATSAPGRFVLDGTAWSTRFGLVTVASRNGGLTVRCADCTLRLPQVSANPIRLRDLALELRRDGDHISGVLSARGSGGAQRVRFDGELSERELNLNWTLARSELSAVFGLIGPSVPELERATLRGSISATGTLSLPQKKWTVVPHLEGFEVHGLGTENLRHGEFTLVCRDRDGRPLQRRAGDGALGWIALDKMGRRLPRAVLAAEDARFHSHAGYDLDELMPLLADSERSGRRGASTITQQLAKNLFVGADPTAARKLRELLYVVEMERTLGKRRILALYLNTVDWGPGLCGAADASRTYFGCSPARLTAADAAWLAGILRNPHRAYRDEFLANKVEPERLAWVLAQLPRSFRTGQNPAFGGLPASTSLK